MKHVCQVSVIALLLAPTAFAGTATMDFDSGVGLLTYQTGSGSLLASGGRASFTGQNVSFVAEEGSPVTSGGTVSATMTLQPSADATNLVGIVMASGGDAVEAVCDGSGYVTITDWIGIYRTASFSYPAAVNNSFTLTYNATTERATLSLNGEQKAFLEGALNGASSVSVGVASGGPGGFAGFSATGSGIPDYPPAVVDTDGDGVSDEEELNAGTDPEDPGSRSISGDEEVTLNALNGASVTFPAGCVGLTINAGVATPPSVPAGAVPGDLTLSGAGLELTPNGTSFSTPVSVTMPYTAGQVANLEPSTLTPLFYDSGAWSATGIADVAVDAEASTVSFTTTHFTIFALGGDLLDSDSDGTPDIDDAFPHNPNGQTDTDGDGLGDEWEILYFGNLTTADETTDSDSDTVSDLQEFQLYEFNLNPTDGTSALPAAGFGGLVAAAALIIALSTRRRK